MHSQSTGAIDTYIYICIQDPSQKTYVLDIYMYTHICHIYLSTSLKTTKRSLAIDVSGPAISLGNLGACICYRWFGASCIFMLSH